MVRRATPVENPDAGGSTVPAGPVAPDDVRGPTRRAVDEVSDPTRRALDVLDTIAHDGMVDVVVTIAHDGLFVDDQVSLPVCERTAGLLEIGYVDIAIPESP